MYRANFSLVFLLFFVLCGKVVAAEELTGLYQTVDKKTRLPTSVIAIYTFQGKYYGKIVAVCGKGGKIEETMSHATSRAPGIIGNPYYCGLDIVWSCVPDGKGVHKGYVIDPRAGKKYTAKIWKQNNNVILRGELLMFGRNETLVRFPEENFNDFFPKPNLSAFAPRTIKLK